MTDKIAYSEETKAKARTHIAELLKLKAESVDLLADLCYHFAPHARSHVKKAAIALQAAILPVMDNLSDEERLKIKRKAYFEAKMKERIHGL